MATELETAERIARSAHAGQIEKLTGDPYIHHVERVVSLVEGKRAKSVAWLHDVPEDSPMDAADLLNEGISERVVAAVSRLTRSDEETYSHYIQRIKNSEDDLAIVVKIADLRDHLRPNCPANLRQRYEKSLITLGEQPEDELPFTESDFLNALKKVSRKVEKKGG